MDLATELAKEQYTGKSSTECLEMLYAVEETAVGQIKTGNLKHLEGIIAGGLWRDKMADMRLAARDIIANPDSTVEEKALANIQLKVVAGFHEAIAESKLANKSEPPHGHSINMSDPLVAQTFAAAQLPQISLITAEEVTKVMLLATYIRKPFESVTLKEVIAIKEPEIIADGSWQTLPETSARKLRIMLNAEAPEQTYITVQMSEDGQNWFHATAIHGIKDVRPYYCDLPYYGSARLFRWRCEYVVNCTLTVI